MEVLLNTPLTKRGKGVEVVEVAGVAGAMGVLVTLTDPLLPMEKDGFSSKIYIPEFGGKKGHSGDVTEAFRQWARCITYYRDYYQDSYLIPLVVSSLTGDASDVFDWILSLYPGNTQNLTTLLQMLRDCDRRIRG